MNQKKITKKEDHTTDRDQPKEDQIIEDLMMMKTEDRTKVVGDLTGGMKKKIDTHPMKLRKKDLEGAKEVNSDQGIRTDLGTKTELGMKLDQEMK